METVNSVVNAASEAIWGKSDSATSSAHNETGGQEPVSGAMGAGTATEPYDKGNESEFVPSFSATTRPVGATQSLPSSAFE